MSTEMRNMSQMDEAPRGYPQIAELINRIPELAIYRQFRGLNARIILYMQSELTYLEQKLYEVEQRDANDPDEFKRRYSKDFYFLMGTAHEPDNDQWKLIKQVEAVLDRYNTLLIQQSTLAGISKPLEHDLKFFQRWFKRKDLGYMPLEGADSNIWGEWDEESGTSRYIDDLIAVNRNRDELDPVTDWIAYTLVPKWHDRVGSRRHPEVHVYQKSHLVAFTSAVATVLASLLPVGGIAVLYVIQDMTARLAVIGVLTAVFSLVLAMITKAKRGESFAATAAFAAVMVVFVGSVSLPQTS